MPVKAAQRAALPGLQRRRTGAGLTLVGVVGILSSISLAGA